MERMVFIERSKASIDYLERALRICLTAGNTLYLCGECADIGIGAVPLLIESEVDHIIWKDFGFENDYEDVVHIDVFRTIGQFTSTLVNITNSLTHSAHYQSESVLTFRGEQVALTSARVNAPTRATLLPPT